LALHAIPVFLIFLTSLVPAGMLLVMPTQAQATTQESDPNLVIVSGDVGKQDIPLKAIQDSNGDIDTQNDFEIEPDDIVTIERGDDFHVLPNQGSIFAVKATDERLETVDLEFSQSDGRVKQDLQSKAYLLDVIVEMDNDDLFLYETILAVLAPGQDLNEDNRQDIIQNFVSSSSNTDVKIIFRDDNDDSNDNEPPAEEKPSICYFKPNDSPECEPVDGECPDGFSMNEQGNCHPGGKCPNGFERVDDDESGTCYSKQNTFHCPISNAIVLDPDDCAIYEPDLPPAQIAAEADNDTSDASDIETEDVVEDEEQEEALTSNCGGEPCTATQKEDSWLSDEPESSPGVPAEPESEPEPEEQESNDEETQQEPIDE
jgi:hypothetical protein